MSAIATGATAEVAGVEHNQPARTPAHRGENIHVSR
jgi:hypothetical protein